MYLSRKFLSFFLLAKIVDFTKSTPEPYCDPALLKAIFPKYWLDRYAVISLTNNYHPADLLNTFEFYGVFNETWLRLPSFQSQKFAISPNLYLICYSTEIILTRFLDSLNFSLQQMSYRDQREKRTIIVLSLPTCDILNSVASVLTNFSLVFQQNSYSYITCSKGDSTRLSVYEIYNIKNQIQVLESVDQVSEATEIIRRRSDMRGVTIRTIVQTVDGITPQLRVNENGLDMAYGVADVHIKTLIQALNYRFEGVPGDGWISQEDDGTLGGLGRQLLNYEADVSCSDSEAVLYRVKQLTASQPTMTRRCEIFFKRITMAEAKCIFFANFTWPAWVATTVSLVAVFAIWLAMLYVVVRVNGVELKIPERSSNLSIWAIFMDAFWGFVGILTQQGSESIASTTSIRMLVLNGLLFSTFLYNVYSANFMSLFASDLNLVKKLDDLADNNFELIVHSRTVAQGIILEDLLEKRFHKKVQIPRLTSMDDVIDRINYSRAATLSVPYYIFGTKNKHEPIDLCPFKSGIVIYSCRDQSVSYLRKNDPFTVFYNYKLQMMRERGHLHRYALKFDEISTVPKCPSPQPEVYSLSMSNLDVAFAIAAVGPLLGTLMLLLELVWRAHCRRAAYLIRNCYCKLSNF